jgi:hypothetical protein
MLPFLLPRLLEPCNKFPFSALHCYSFLFFSLLGKWLDLTYEIQEFGTGA